MKGYPVGFGEYFGVGIDQDVLLPRARVDLGKRKESCCVSRLPRGVNFDIKERFFFWKLCSVGVKNLRVIFRESQPTDFEPSGDIIPGMHAGMRRWN